MEDLKIQAKETSFFDSLSKWSTFWTYIKVKAHHPGIRKYSKNTAWMFTARIGSMLVSFLATAYIARNLGPGNFGQLSYAVSFVSLFSFLYSLGIDNVLYRDLIKHPGKKNEYLGSAFFIKMSTGIITALIIIIFALILTKDTISLILIFILSGTFLFNSFQIINYEFQSRVEAKYPSIISFCVSFTLNILKILVILYGKGVIYLAIILLLESILYAGAYLLIYKVKLKEKITDWKFDKDITISLIKDSWPLIFTGVFAMIYARIDQVFIKHMIDSHAVGIYDSAVRIVEVWYFLPSIIVSSLFPAIMNAKLTSIKLYESRLTKLAILLTVLSVGIAIPMTFFASLIIKIVYGPAFIDAVIILKIYIWSGIGSFLSNLAGCYLIVENKRKLLFFFNFVPMITNVILNLLWIPSYGIIGSAYATLISYSLGPIFLIIVQHIGDRFTKKPQLAK